MTSAALRFDDLGGENGSELDDADASAFRSLVARADCSTAGRRDTQHACKDWANFKVWVNFKVGRGFEGQTKNGAQMLGGGRNNHLTIIH